MTQDRFDGGSADVVLADATAQDAESPDAGSPDQAPSQPGSGKTPACDREGEDAQATLERLIPADVPHMFRQAPPWVDAEAYALLLSAECQTWRPRDVRGFMALRQMVLADLEEFHFSSLAHEHRIHSARMPLFDLLMETLRADIPDMAGRTKEAQRLHDGYVRADAEVREKVRALLSQAGLSEAVLEALGITAEVGPTTMLEMLRRNRRKQSDHAYDVLVHLEKLGHVGREE